MAELWQLPGPLQHLQTVADDLNAGRSVILVRSARRPPLDHEHELRRLLGPTRDWERVQLGPADGLDGPDLVDAIFERFSLSDHGAHARRTAEQLATHPDWHYRVVWVDATSTPGEQLERWWRFLSRYVSISQSVATLERTPIITVIDGDAADDLPEDDVLLTRRWWWSVIDRVDTTVHVGTLTRDRAFDPVLVSACVEVAGFDLELAEELVGSWDGDLDAAVEIVRGRGEHVPDEHRTDVLTYEPASTDTHPRRPHLRAWNDGVVDRWGGRAWWHPAVLHGDGLREHLRHLIWRAQMSAMLPELETRRLDLARWCEHRKEHLPNDHFAEVDVLELEYGNLIDFMRMLPVGRRDPARLELLRWVKGARDLLAHADILEPAALQQGRQLLARAPTGLA